MDMTSCRKIGEMNNNVNNQPLYSMGVYMCLELPGQQNTVPDTNLLDFSETRNNNNIKNLSNSTILNSQNHTHFINSTKNIESWNNSTNITLTTTTNISYTPSPTTTSTSVPTTPSLTTTPSPTTITQVITPSPTTVKPTTLAPSTNEPPDPTTNSPTPSPVTRQEPDNPIKSNIPINNTQNSETFHNNPPPNIKLEDNPLLPIVITLLSILALAFCGVCCKCLYNKRKLKKISCNKSDKKEEPDIESGEKKNRNSWTFSHKNVAQKNCVLWNNLKKQEIEQQRKRH